jgi:hypothetical protein
VKCPACGETIRISSQEKDRKLELERRPSHKCENYPFPHVPGSMRMCTEHPEYLLGFEPDADEKDAYHLTLDTPRTRDDWGYPEPVDEFAIDADDFEVPF